MNIASKFEIIKFKMNLNVFSTKYSIKRNEKIVSFFDNFDSYLTEDALWQISEEIKPRPKKKTSKQMEPS